MFKLSMKSTLASFFNKENYPKVKIGVLYICTGKYNIFWDDFYKSANKYFCKKSEVHYFVFTEYPIKTFGNNKIHHILQQKLGWPFDTLKRFHLFLEQSESLEKMDYLFFFNANMIFKKNISEREILPSQNSDGLISVLHPYFYDHQCIAPFEDNSASFAYVKASKEMNYFQGCLSGGRTKEYLKMAKEIKDMVESDLAKNIIGKWWDESYMNKYFQVHPPQILSPSYAYPESTKFPFSPKIIQLDKGKLGGHTFLRN
jgi:hypothetical protein